MGGWGLEEERNKKKKRLEGGTDFSYKGEHDGGKVDENYASNIDRSEMIYPAKEKIGSKSIKIGA